MTQVRIFLWLKTRNSVGVGCHTAQYSTYRQLPPMFTTCSLVRKAFQGWRRPASEASGRPPAPASWLQKYRNPCKLGLLNSHIKHQNPSFLNLWTGHLQWHEFKTKTTSPMSNCLTTALQSYLTFMRTLLANRCFLAASPADCNLALKDDT